jgi:hypothetical protein
MENQGEMMPAEENSQQSSDRKQEKWAKGMRIFSCKVFLFILANYFITCRKILRHWADGFTSEGRCAADC